MGREENIMIFKDTERFVKSNQRIKAAVRASTDMQKLILESEQISVPSLLIYEEEAKVVVHF